ncbi:MAG TPA: tetratricopeptide repeat protein [Thermoanaerobaculia bacterium]
MAPKARRAAVAGDALYRAAEVLTHLLDFAHTELDRNGEAAFTLTTLIVDTIEAEPEDGVSYDLLLRSRAWKEHALALLPLKGPADALYAIRKASKLFGDKTVYPVERANIILTEGLVLYKLGEQTAALCCIAAAKAIYEVCGDAIGQTKALQMSGAVHYELTQYRRAENTFVEALQLAENGGDRAGAARSMNNLAACAVKLEKFEVASQWYGRALEAFEALEMTAEVQRAKVAQAGMLGKQRKVEEALAAFFATREEFLRRGMVIVAAEVGLQIAALLVQQERLQEARPICEEIVTIFTEAGMTTQALKALAYMHQGGVEDSGQGEVADAVIQRAITGPILDREQLIRDVAESTGLPEEQVSQQIALLSGTGSDGRVHQALQRLLEVWQKTAGVVFVETGRYRETRDRLLEQPGVNACLPVLLERLRRDPYAEGSIQEADAPLRSIRSAAAPGSPALQLFYAIDADARVLLLQLDSAT